MATHTTSECTQILVEVNIFVFRLARELTASFSEFLLGGPGRNVSWSFNDDGTNIILSEQFIQPVPFSEFKDQALDSVEYYCHKRVSNMETLSIYLTYSYLQLDQRNLNLLANLI